MGGFIKCFNLIALPLAPLLALFVLVPGCNFNHPRAPAPASDDATRAVGDAYPRLAAELFNPTCANCHNHGRAAGGVNVTTYELVTAPGLVVAGNSGGSLLMQVIASGVMPRGGAPVKAELQTALACWIDRGAPQTGAGDCFPTAATDGGDAGGADAGGTDNGGGDAGPGPAGTDDFVRLTQELFTPSCAGCHNTQRAAGGVNVTSYEAIASGGLIVVGNSAGSLLHQVIKTGDMPRGGGTVAPRLLTALACWIDRGAPRTGTRGCFAATPPPVTPDGDGGDDGSGNDDGGNDDGDADGAPDDDDFVRLTQVLFKPSCTACHNAEHAAAGVNLTTYAQITDPNAGLITRGDSARSLLHAVIRTGSMPRGGRTVAPGALDALACWINAGAPETGKHGCFGGVVTPTPGDGGDDDGRDDGDDDNHGDDDGRDDHGDDDD